MRIGMITDKYEVVVSATGRTTAGSSSPLTASSISSEVDGAEHVQEVTRVEADRELGTRVVDVHFVEAFTAVWVLALEAHLAAGERELDATRAVACCHGDGAQRVPRAEREARAPSAHCARE